jgi:molybdate transport system substrate-binding protein
MVSRVNWARNVFGISLMAAMGLLALLWWSSPSPRSGLRGAPLLVYCAAGLKPPVEQLAHAFEAECGVPVELQYGGSGTLLSNLRVTQRGDLFIAADESYLELARSNGVVTRTWPIGQMQMVVAVRRGNPKLVRSLADLLRPEVSVALANPEAAAVGKLLRELLEPTGDWAALEHRAKVFKPTVSDVANDIVLGAVDAGVVWDATVRLYPNLEALRFPPIDRGTQRVAVGLLRSSSQSATAALFAGYLTARDRGLVEFARAGYRVVPGELWTSQPAKAGL